MMVISNAGPLIALGKLGWLALLPQLYGPVWLPTAVYNEVVIQGERRSSLDAFLVAEAIRQGSLVVVEVRAAELSLDMAELSLDAGEKQVLHLAIQHQAHLVLLDDQKARETAQAYGLVVKGTLGVLVQAYRTTLLQLEELQHLMGMIMARDDIWIAADLCRQVLKSLEAGETVGGDASHHAGVP